jgi:hypothetical protein
MIDLKKLYAAAEIFEKRAQQISSNTSLVDNLRKNLGGKITQDLAKFLNTRAVSSIPVRIQWNKPQASFVVDAMGSEGAAVSAEAKALLDKKYGPMVSRMLAREPANFEFGLLTVE